MPKKPARNAYYYFMLHFREEQKKKGITYANMGEVQQAADPVWRQANPAERAKFEAIAKKEKEKFNVPEKKYTSQGVPISEIERQQRLLQEAEETEVKDIKNFVTLNSFNNAILDQDIYIIDVNSYCHTNSHYLISESTVLRFNLREGIKDHYHESINPGKIPIGYASDVKLGCVELGLKMPDEDAPRADFLHMLANIIDYLKQQDRNAKVLPPLYTMPEKVEQVQDFIIQMCIKAGEDDSLFRVYKLDLLFFHLINNIKINSNEGFPKLSLASDQMKKDPFKYTQSLSCEFHEEGVKSVECTTSRVKRWAYTILDSCCPVAGIEPVQGNHVPFGVDIHAILNYKETKKESVNPYAHNTGPDSSCASSVYEDSAASSAPFELVQKKGKRTHKPLRMPKSDLSQNLRTPEVSGPTDPTELHQPLTVGGLGRGRLSSSLNKMRLDN